MALIIAITWLRSFLPLLMIRFTTTYPKCPINLLKQHYSKQLMRKGHLTKTKTIVSSF